MTFIKIVPAKKHDYRQGLTVRYSNRNNLPANNRLERSEPYFILYPH